MKELTTEEKCAVVLIIAIFIFFALWFAGINLLKIVGF